MFGALALTSWEIVSIGVLLYVGKMLAEFAAGLVLGLYLKFTGQDQEIAIGSS